MERVYLDHNATTPLDRRVLEAMLPILESGFGNPSSLHWFGQRARGAVEDARAQVAALIGASPSEIVFTGSGTEADNMALRGVAGTAKEPRRKIVHTAVEHHAVINTGKALLEEGWPVETVRVGQDGVVDLDNLRARVDGGTALVCVMLANNETGVVQPVAEVVKIARERGALVLCDAVQAYGRMAIPEGPDLIAVSAHKIFGPKGIGALWVRDGLRLPPFILGGGQEQNMRSGTVSPALVAGFGAAAKLAAERMEEDNAHVARLWDVAVEALAGWTINGSVDQRIVATGIDWRKRLPTG